MKILVTVLMLVTLVPLSACTDKLAQTGYITIVGAKAATDKAKQLHPECPADTASNACIYISKAVGAKDAVIDAMEIYCAGPDFDGGKGCDTPSSSTSVGSQAISKLNAALSSWTQASTDLQTVMK